MPHHEPCCRATLLLMGIGFLRGATFPKRDQIDRSLDWTQPYERTPPTQTDRSLSHDPGESILRAKEGNYRHATQGWHGGQGIGGYCMAP